jgi:signal transduction histidine kinase
VVIRLRGSNAELSFEVRDDGRGFDPSSARGSGLQGMADRLDAIGGTFELETAPGRGTVVRGTVPATPATGSEVSSDGGVAAPQL